MKAPVAYVARILDDRASLTAIVEPLLAEPARGSDGEPLTIGLLGWTNASQEEIATLAEFRDRHAGPLVAILAQPPTARGARVIAARLEGAVMADDIEYTLQPTLAAVAIGQCVVPRTIRQIVDRPALSPRERQILAMIVLDFSNGEIARKLFVTESNVKNHLSSAFQKLGVKSRSAAAELILDRESGLGPGILHISPEESLPEIR
ncbi:MAG TPA: LuxR C-terminal-related transcriptional regulator [Solirubrobacteraceae bacterium]|nr:LuxR C-terminal-related transcriptional regulator [Solirubrobacteraceae bacterium]